MNKLKPEDRLLTICRKCEYRRNEHNNEYYRGDSRRKSRCAYLDITGNVRGCAPTEITCCRFLPRLGAKNFGKSKEFIK